MDSNFWDPAGLVEKTAPAWDRFAHWPQFRAQLGLLALILMLIASAIVPIEPNKSAADVQSTTAASDDASSARDPDLALYDRVIERIRAGENYYDFIVEEQRQSNYPVKPGLTVRLPTLAYIQAFLGETGQTVSAILLVLAVFIAWQRRLEQEPGAQEQRLLMLMLLGLMTSLALNPYYFVLHEFRAGLLLALSFALHRPGKWAASLVVATLALAIREHALPFVLLMGAMAFWRRDWKEGTAWTTLTCAFLIVLALHAWVVAAHVLPDDPQSPPWLVMRGLSGWLSNIVQSSPLNILPGWLSGLFVVLTLVGWAGWRSPAGTFGTFLYLGYGLAFMLAGRVNNFYWGTVITPAIFMGFAFARRSVTSLIGSAFPQRVPQLALAK